MALDELREQLEAGEARADELRESWRAELESSEHRGVAAQEATTSLLEELLDTRKYLTLPCKYLTIPCK